MRKATVILTGLLALALLVLVGRNASTELDVWFVYGPSIAGAGIALFIGSLGVYARMRPRRSTGSAQGFPSKLLYLFGEASLSIYLWHTFFIDLALIAAYRWQLGSMGKILLLFATVPAALATSILTYRAIEAPVIAFSKSAAWRSRVGLLVGRASAIWRDATLRGGSKRSTPD